MPWHSPERKTEQAFKALFSSVEDVALKGVQIATRFCGVVKALPQVQIVCDRAAPWIKGDVITGNWRVAVRVIVRTRYEKAEDATAHDDLAAVVSDVLFTSDIVASLNAVTSDEDFTAVLFTPGDRSNSVQEKDYETEMTGELLMAPSKL
jgi:hypothetical protein